MIRFVIVYFFYKLITTASDGEGDSGERVGCVCGLWRREGSGGEERGGWSWEVEGLKGQGICLCGYTTSSNKIFFGSGTRSRCAQSCNLF